MRCSKQFALLLATLLLASLGVARPPIPSPQDKDYLSDSESDKIRDADTPALRIKLYISFAEDRLKKFEYEIHRTVPERRRGEILNALLNGYSGCVDDAADQIDVAQEKQQDIREALKMMRAKNKEFLDTLEKYDKDGPELDTYRDTLEDAIEGTKDALSDIDDAEKEATPGPVRRKPS
jgi:predicted RNase H-like nuclease (RuvC/YqgF family)